MGVPDSIRPLFHNYEPDSIDLDRDWSFVIKTVMQGGEWGQIQWAAQYSLSALRRLQMGKDRNYAISLLGMGCLRYVWLVSITQLSA